MSKNRIFLALAVLVLAAAGIAPIARCQQPPAQQPAAQQPAALSPSEQEFFDAIRQGNATKVNDLLKQQPALIKSHWKNGASPILFAVYANHPEIADSLIATGVEPDIFEAAATGRT